MARASRPAIEISAEAPPDGERTTRERLIDAAERLFAEHGIEAVSLGRITREAGQRNASALHYHLGSKETLIQAIFERRMADINARRLSLLAGVDVADRMAALRAVAEALILPFAEQLEAGAGGRHYVRFVAQVYGDPRLSMFDLVRGRHDDGMRRAGELVPAILADLPVAVVRRRLAFATILIIQAVATQARGLSAGRTTAPAERGAFVDDLVDAVVGTLAAAVGAGRCVSSDRPA